jgi:hypothetical protein
VYGDRNFVLMRQGLQIKLVITTGKFEPHHGGTHRFVVPPRPGLTASFASVVVQTSHSIEENDEFALGIVNYERSEHRGKEVGILYSQKNYLCFLLVRSKEGKVFHKVNTSNVLTVRTTFPGWGSFEPLVTVWL